MNLKDIYNRDGPRLLEQFIIVVVIDLNLWNNKCVSVCQGHGRTMMLLCFQSAEPFRLGTVQLLSDQCL